MTEVAISWWNVNLKKLTIGLQLHMPRWVLLITQPMGLQCLFTHAWLPGVDSEADMS